MGGEPPKRPRVWSASGTPPTALNYGGERVLALVPDAYVNTENLAALVACLNAAGIRIKKPKVVGVSVATLPAPTNAELERQCVGKKRMSENGAKRAAEKYGYRIYPCVLCHGWHCTHVEPDWRPTK